MRIRSGRMGNASAGALAIVALTLLPSAALAEGDTGRIDHVQDRNGTVQVLFSVPGLPEGVAPDPSSIEVSLDGRPVDATAAVAEADSGQVRRTAVLAIDVSNSMRGSKFDAARRAALTYITQAPADVYVGLVTFASDVTVVAEPTRDRAVLTSAVDKLALTRQTHLYDGLLRALEVSGNAGQRSILLLSDGKDTSRTELDTALAAVRRAGVRVDVVALDQALPADSPLSQVARRSGGTTTSTSDAGALEGLFAQEADDLSKQLVVSFAVPEGTDGSTTLAVTVQADGRPFSDRAFVKLAPSADGGPSAPAYSSPPAAAGTTWSRPMLWAGAGLLFLGLAGLLAFAVVRVLPTPMTPMERQLSLYTVEGMRRSPAASPVDQGSQWRESAVAVASGLLDRRDFETRLASKLDRAGLGLKAAEWLLLHVGIAVASGLVGLVLSGGGILVTLLLFVLGAALPYVYLSVKESRRIKAFNGNLAQTLQIIAGALQAGLSLPQAVDTVVQEGSEPVAGEFRRAIIEQRLGIEIEDALDSVAERMQSTDFKWVVMAVRIQREVGGNLSELLLTVAATLREREYLRRQVSVLSAEGRLSAYILGGLPPLFVAYLAFARPTYLAPMVSSPLGWGMIVVGCVLMAIGVFWLKAAVKVEV